jgi:LmbE family N-acetylglucosaminyl deacetylase
MKVLCVAAHPDDEVLGVGGTLLKHRDAGDEVSVILLHECRDESDLESDEAERRMGVTYHRLYRTGFTFEALVAGLKPDIVYTHSRADLHHDHQDALYRTLVACRPQSGVRAIYSFETPSATDWSGVPFTPQRFVDISRGELDGKLYAMEAYDSELRYTPHPRSLAALSERAGYWGQRVGVDYAEAFEVIRECA